MNILEHKWGVSRGADRVWAQVAGLSPKRAGGRLFLVWQAYIDESYDNDAFAIAGWLASAEQWASFSKEWEDLLPLAYKNKHGVHEFKMAEMAAVPERLEDTQAFYRVIERHAMISLSFSMRKSDFQRGVDRIVLLGGDGSWGAPRGIQIESLYVWAFAKLLDMFNNARTDPTISDIVPLSEKIDFYFDDLSEKAHIIPAWEGFIQSCKYPELFGPTPRFEDSAQFMPLQAADLLVWWVRKLTAEGVPHDRIMDAPCPWVIKRPTLYFHSTMTEDDVAGQVEAMCSRHYPKHIIQDRKQLDPWLAAHFDPRRRPPEDC